MMEMYLHGVSTRKVKTITKELCGHEFSSSTISRIVQQLDGELGKFARRRLERHAEQERLERHAEQERR